MTAHPVPTSQKTLDLQVISSLMLEPRKLPWPRCRRQYTKVPRDKRAMPPFPTAGRKGGQVGRGLLGSQGRRRERKGLELGRGAQ